MKFIAAFTVAYCAITICNAGPIYSGTKGPYDKGIVEAGDAAIATAKNKIETENAKRGDLANIVANVVRIPQLYGLLAPGILRAVPYTVNSTVEGLTKGLESPGNLLDKLTATLRSTTGALLSGQKKFFTEAIKNSLTFGRNPKTDPAAAKVSKNIDRSFELGQQQQAARQKGKGNVAGTLKNVNGLVRVFLQYLKNTVVQTPPVLQNTISGVFKGLKQGLKKGGLLSGVTGALSQGTTRTVKSMVNTFGQIQKDTMKV